MRTLIAAIIGGLVVFAWGYVSHTVLHLAENTIKPLPNAEDVVGRIRADVLEPGIYTFPYCPPAQMKDDKAMAKFEDDYQKGPNGTLIRGRDGEKPMTTNTLLYQFCACVVGSFILALFLGKGSSIAGAITKMFVGAGFGAFAWVSQDAPMWIWYRFPWDYEQAVLIDALIGWTAAAFVMALVLKKTAPPAKK
jgi:hypothetical protein